MDLMEFRYARISSVLIQTLLLEVLSGHSVVLLGPRYVGKRHVLERLEAEFCRIGHRPLVLRMLRQTPVVNSNGLRELLAHAVSEVYPEFEFKMISGEPFEPVDQLWRQTGKPLILLGA